MEQIRNNLPITPPALIYQNLLNEKVGIVCASQPEEIPRGKEQIYDMKRKMKVSNSSEELIAYLQHSEEPAILQHYDIPEDLWVFGTQQMCADLTSFLYIRHV